jgi:acetyltransferase-like isoleucine patch superfamily enzyme
MPLANSLDYSPWDFWKRADAAARQRQLRVQGELADERPGWSFGEACFVSELASVDNDDLVLGDRTYIAAGAYLTGSLTAGRDCSINVYSVIRGDVSIGDAVRIGAHTSIIGFNHTMTDTAVEFFRQPLTSRGIRIGDDVWIGSHVVILDGVAVGDQSVLAAGAVVTRDVPAGAIVGGNPARVLRWRVPAAEPVLVPGDLAIRVAAFGDRVRDEARAVLDRSFVAETGLFVDRPGATATVRAQCDAVEIADLLLGAAPPQAPVDTQVDRLLGWQDAATGAVRALDDSGRQPGPGGFDDPDAAYHVLSVGYALALLGERFASPLTLVTRPTAGEIAATVEALPWATDAWGAGHHVDAIGTAMHFSLDRGDQLPEGSADALFGWLLRSADAQSGMWGLPTADEGLLQLVNGFYRTSRGTFAQFGLPVPYPERVIDTVLRHARDERYFASDRRNACNVLDIAHPLWLTRASGYRSDEVTALARTLLDDALGYWVDGAGFAFRAPHPNTTGLPETTPGLQGTEMWLAIAWYLADLAGVSDALGYRPRGVHRPEPAPRRG